MQNNKNLILAMIISVAFLVLWQYFYELPRREKFTQSQNSDSIEVNNSKNQEQNKVSKITDVTEVFTPNAIALASEKRIKFENSKIKGSINPTGLQIDNLELKNYKTNGLNTTLLSPSSTREAYFSQFGFTSSTEGVELPNSNTVWDVVSSGDNSFIAQWKNAQNIIFKVILTLDENYMFDIKQEVENNSNMQISVAPFARILRTEPQAKESTVISHEGFVFNASKTFNELKYSKLERKKRIEYKNERELFWGGFADKYWLSSFFYNNIFCISGTCGFTGADLSLNHLTKNNINAFQIDFIVEEKSLRSGDTLSIPSKFFAGAKELKMLDEYANKGFNFEGKTYKFNNFDKTVDFGIFWFLTKPIFLLITFLNAFLHNFGFAIIVLTLIVKLALFPLATKSYISMGKMKLIAPEIQVLREKITDKIELNKKIMELYRDRKINPLSGCLPIILQIPVFFALYKVLYISLEMRDAPFIWWIVDLSYKDPTSIFNLFGLLPFAVPSFLEIGVLPILMGLTTFLQQSLSPKSADPTQNMIIKTMPLILIFIFASFPSGIVLYWVVNNIFSIIQQLFIEKIILPKSLKKSYKNKK